VESLYFQKITDQPLSSTSSPSPCFAYARARELPPSPAMCRAPAASRRFPQRHVPSQHPRRLFPAHAGPLRAPPRRAAAARASTRTAGLPAVALAHPCLLLDLEHVLELPTDSLLRSHTCISTAFHFPEHPTSPEPRRSPGFPSTAASAASHPRSSALEAPPPPTGAPQPAQFRSLAQERPDHYAGELELPPPLGLAVVPPIHRLSAPDKYTTSTTSSRGSYLATSLALSCPPATGTPTPSLGTPLPVSVRR
jgi:hypothetical protein